MVVSADNTESQTKLMGHFTRIKKLRTNNYCYRFLYSVEMVTLNMLLCTR